MFLLLVDPVNSTALVGGHLLWLEPQSGLLLGTLYGVAAVDDVPAKTKRRVSMPGGSTVGAMF